MSYLLDGERKAYPSWRNYFDIVIVGGAKPAFFNELRPFVADRSGDRRSRWRRNGEIKHLPRDKVYQGGNVIAFEQMTGIKGEQVLYIGDHIYGDILRLRKQHMWRTAMVLQELEREIRQIRSPAPRADAAGSAGRRAHPPGSELNERKAAMRIAAEAGRQRPRRPKSWRRKRTAKERAREAAPRSARRRRRNIARRDGDRRRVQPLLGAAVQGGQREQPLRRAGEAYACLYTSRVSNFLSTRRCSTSARRATGCRTNASCVGFSPAGPAL